LACATVAYAAGATSGPDYVTVPVRAVTWVEGQTTMPGLRSIRSTRYRDIEASSASRRMMTFTVAHERLRNRALQLAG